MAALTPGQMLSQLEAFEQSINQEGTQAMDPILRVKLQQTARRILSALEDPFDLTSRVLVQQPVEELAVRIGADLKIYEILAAAKTPLSVPELAQAAKADVALLQRILRTLAAFGSIREAPNQCYTSSPSAAHLAQPEFAACFGTCQDWLNPAYHALPQKLAVELYKLPQNDPLDTALTYAYSEKGKDLFQILMARPEKAAAFGQLMNTWGQHGSLLHDVYPVEQLLGEGYDSSISDVLLVDVGGGWGQKSIAVKRANPQLPGRLISQDLPHIIAPAPKTNLCEINAHDFFTPQPIKNPRAFYIRQTLHNWSDADCVKIISNLRDAMKPGYTRLLLHEQIVPVQGASPWTVTQDFNMMVQLATEERTLEQWTDIINKANLHVKQVFPAKDGVSESVIEVEKKV